MAIKHSTFIGILLCLGWSIGCGSPPPVCQVRGKVLVAGKPAGELYVRFQSLDNDQLKALPDATTTEADGTFSLVVKAPGEYGVTAIWPMVTMVDGERFEGDDRLGGRYNNLLQPIQKLNVVVGENVVPDINLR